MPQNYIAEQDFDKIDFTARINGKVEYENCKFSSCNFLSTDLSTINFTNCEFTECNLSTAKVMNTAFRDTKFINCKMVGVHFENCNQFLLSMSFEGCQLNLSSFYKLPLKKTLLKNCNLQEVDFTECDLTASLIQNCDLANAIFDRTILEKVDLRTSINYSIDPEANKIKKAKFSLDGIPGLLHKYNIEIEN